MNTNWKSEIALLMAIVLLTIVEVHAQDNKQVTISGVIFCEDSIMGTLPDVSIFNKNRSTGSISSETGEYSIQMGRKDTIIFSTVQHMDEVFFIKEDEVFEDRLVNIPMQMDTVWLKVVSVIGIGNYESFRRELMNLELPGTDVSITLPIVNKYAREYSTGEGSIKIRGPLTYLSEKIYKWKMRKTNNTFDK